MGPEERSDPPVVDRGKDMVDMDDPWTVGTGARRISYQTRAGSSLRVEYDLDDPSTPVAQTLAGRVKMEHRLS